ncbi:MAG: hypothetical protein PWQ57_2802 [Desulfovibrionales bacterium]|nr:hypothetical protein [Desulfovibrionales bacterium]
MTNRYLVNWSIWIGFWSGVYVYIYLLTPLAGYGVIWMTFVALPIYFNGGAKREEFVNYAVSAVIGVLWGLAYLYCIGWLVDVGVEAKLSTALVIFVLTTAVCAVHFLMPKALQMKAVPVMFGAIASMFSQNGGKVLPAICTLIGGVFLGLLCNEGSKLLNEKGRWKFFDKRLES